MKHAVLTRTDHRGCCCRGYLAIGTDVLAVLEQPWRDNERNVSCIPTGRYECRYLEKSASGRYRRVWHLQEVQGRSGILIHTGNLVRHTRGCILVGMRKGQLAGEPAVLNSRTGMERLRTIVGEQAFTLEVRDGVA